MNIKIKKRPLFCLMTIVFITSLSANSLFAKKKENKNIILVLDTSMSMIGYGGSNIMDKVKDSIGNYIDKIDDGDKVTFITFDTEVKIYPTVLIEDKNDRDIVKKYISATEARGKWTYTINMLKSIFKKAEDLTNLEKERKTVIVIMTDGIDDPPPGKRKEAFNIKTLTSEYSGKDWWIYLINFGDLKKNEKITAELARELKKVSDKTQVIDASKSPEKGIGEIDKTAVPREGFPIWIIIAIAAVAVLIILLLIMKKKGGVKVTGRLEYWNTDILDPYLEAFDLTKHMAGEIFIGRKADCQLNIRDLEISGVFSIVALKQPLGLTLKAGEGVEIQYKNKETSGILADGDIFQVANYGFKYYSS